MGRQTEDREPKGLVADGQVSDTRADGDHLAGHFVAENPRVGSFRRIKRQRLEHVAEIHARRLDLDEHLARRAHRQGERHELQAVEQPALTRF